MDTRTEIATRIAAAFVALPGLDDLTHGDIARKAVIVADILMAELAVPARPYRAATESRLKDGICDQCGCAEHSEAA